MDLTWQNQEWSLFYKTQLISSPQHRGDFIFPSHEGHFDTCTVEPLSKFKYPFTRGIPHLPHEAFTDIPH